VKSIEENSDEDSFNLLNNNYDKIVSDYFKIDENINKSIVVNGETISPVGVLHYAISKKNKNVVHNLLYYGCNFEKKCGGYSPIHLAAIWNLPEIGKLLKMYGASMEEECLYGGEMASIFEICNQLGHYDFIMKILS